MGILRNRLRKELNWVAVQRGKPIPYSSPARFGPEHSQHVVPSAEISQAFHRGSPWSVQTNQPGDRDVISCAPFELPSEVISKLSAAERGSLEPIIKDDVVYYEHQIDGVRHLATMRNFLLADDMGLGKSLQALTVFAIDVFRDWARTAIVVCPVTLKGNWEDEISKFTRIPCVNLQGTPKERVDQLTEFALIDGFKILIVNYEQVKPHLDALNAMQFDVAIFDEAHYLKNWKSVRTVACQALLSKRSFLLTGTPMLNNVHELWTLLNRIDPNFYPNYHKFVNRYCVFGGYKDKSIVGVKNERQLREQLAKIMLRRLKKNVLGLPEVQIIERRVDLNKAQQELYDQAESEMDLPDPSSATRLQIQNSLTLFLRLKQISGTTYPFTGVDDSAKLDLCIEDDHEILENGRKVIIFTQFRDVQECYIRRAREDHSYPIFQLNGDVKQKDRVPIVKAWEAVDGPAVLVCMLQVSREGLNMTAARDIAFLDELFVPGLNQQAIDRAHRIGASMTQPVQVRRYVARKTKDARIQTILNTKKQRFKLVIEADTDAWKMALEEAASDDD